MTTSTGAGTLTDALPRFRDVFTRLAGGAGERDGDGTAPYELVAELVAAGFGRLRVPVADGGFGVDLPTLFELLAETGRADSNVPQILRGHFTAVEILRHAHDREAAGYWLNRIAEGAVFGNAQSEVAALSPDFLPTTRIHVLDGRRVVSGVKYYSTGSLYADFIRVGVLDEERRQTFAIVDARHCGVTHDDDWDGIGQRLTGSGTTHFTDVPLLEHGEVGRYTEELKILPAFVQLVHLANLAGIARRIVDDTTAVVASRGRTSPHALTDQARDDPEVLAVLGSLYQRSLTVDALLARVTAGLEDADGLGTDEAYARSFVDVSAAQVAIIEAVLDAATTAFNAGGASSVREAAHLDRHWRNARTLASHNPVIYKPRLIGDYVLNGHAPTSFYSRTRRSTGDAP
jgi:alkylation response protein AidB-like acyl-CoA dehydrogenase